ncbi:hypothetical protein Baya_15523 [Bagarius yarrelli]|uniref:Uncharacterized protein n=1 Tax=Bagarius yarrelli TaxID=175774 RepID=A0A556VBZ4_BAGYA|nr:hypothetical protein Baya_15523 [Bagarius yarrelli]
MSHNSPVPDSPSAFCSTGSSVNQQEKSSDASHDTSLTNGTAPQAESHNTPLQHASDISKGVETLLFLGYTEAEPGQGLCNDDDDDDDDDDVSAVIRAERVMITEEGEEVTQHTPAKEEEIKELEEGEEEEGEEKEKGQEEEERRNKRRKNKGKKEKKKREQVEERETDCKEQSSVDGENHSETWADELTEEHLQNNNTNVDSVNQESKEKTTLYTDEETSADADTHLVRHSHSALNTDLISDEDLAAVPELETPGGAVQTVFEHKPPSASTLNPNGAQKFPDLASTTTTHTTAPFQDIPLDGAAVEEEPLLATKVEPLTDTTSRNQTEGVKRKTCQCCMIM